jgi:hypothetical protein
MKRYLMGHTVFIICFVFMCSTSHAQNTETGKRKIVDFKVESLNNSINLIWATQNPDNDNYFEVERSKDGKNFRTVAIVLGPDPRKSDREYDCIDKDITRNTSYYRVKHVSSTGETQFSETKRINFK